jgi:phosphoribosyl 1,2-cyclic phosphodiesterase
VRFACLGSGSRGNATLVEAGGVRVLVDCGFPARELERRLACLGVDADTLDAILVTHEHGDHIGGLGAVARRYRLPVWCTAGTYRRGRCGELPRLNLFNGHGERIRIGGLEILPYPVPHDAREPCQFVFCGDQVRFGMLTDSGCITAHIVESLRRCDALLLECNHDAEMLRDGPYPPTLQARVGGAFGHLSNAQAAGLLGDIDTGRIRHLLAAHLSQKNNSPELVREALLDAVPALGDRLSLATQEAVTPWLEL